MAGESGAYEAVADALQGAWDDFVGDTGNFPDCFEMRRHTLYAEFDRGNFHRFVADRLVARGVDFRDATLAAPRPLGPDTP